MQENLDTSVKIEIKEEEISVKEEIIKKVKLEWSQINKWWEKEEDENEEIKWMSLEHHGVEFP